MKETIILAPHSNNAELLRSLARYGKSSIGLRIVNPTELASLAMIRNGITCSSAFLNSRDQSSIIYSIISGGGIEYFSSASYADAESIAATLNGLRSLIKENETVEVENTLASGKFVEKNLAILRIYRNYLSVLSEKNLTDRIAYIRHIFSAEKM